MSENGPAYQDMVRLDGELGRVNERIDRLKRRHQVRGHLRPGEIQELHGLNAEGGALAVRLTAATERVLDEPIVHLCKCGGVFTFTERQRDGRTIPCSNHCGVGATLQPRKRRPGG